MCTLIVCMAVKTTLLVDIVIERNFPEKCSSVSLLNSTAPPYLQLARSDQFIVKRRSLLLLPVISLHPQPEVVPGVVARGDLQQERPRLSPSRRRRRGAGGRRPGAGGRRDSVRKPRSHSHRPTPQRRAPGINILLIRSC